MIDESLIRKGNEMKKIFRQIRFGGMVTLAVIGLIGAAIARSYEPWTIAVFVLGLIFAFVTRPK